MPHGAAPPPHASLVTAPARASRSERARREWAGIVFALLSAALFSWKAILAKLLYRTGVTPSTLIGLRMGLSLPFYAVLAWVGARRNPGRLPARDWARLGALSLAGFYVATHLDFVGLKYISAGLERLILFLHPALVALIASWLHRRPVSRREGMAMLLGYGGIAFVFLGDVRGGPRDGNAVVGVTAVFVSSIAYAAYLAFSESLVTRLGSTRFTGLVMSIACSFGLLQSAIAFAAHPTPLPVEALLLGAAIAAFATVIPTWLLNEAISRLGSGRASLLSMSGPVVTIFLEAVVLGDRITATDLAGTGCALAGVTLLTSKRGAHGRAATGTPTGTNVPAPPENPARDASS